MLRFPVWIAGAGIVSLTLILLVALFHGYGVSASDTPLGSWTFDSPQDTRSD